MGFYGDFGAFDGNKESVEMRVRRRLRGVWRGLEALTGDFELGEIL